MGENYTNEVNQPQNIIEPTVEVKRKIGVFKPLIIIWLTLITVALILLTIKVFSSSECDCDCCDGDCCEWEETNETDFPVAYKPNIYLYPEEETTIDVYLTANNLLTSWPYADAVDGNQYYWNVVANPDGTIYQNNNEYSYIFWEANYNSNNDFSKGFCVKGEDTAEFLRTVLSQIGLTPKEYNEFIVFWLPKMQNNEYNLITFEGLGKNDNYNKTFPLTILDENGNTPDSLLRIHMVWKAVDEYTEIEAQTFTTFERNGFTVVEWGGSEIKE